jgi:hypothetical protein
VNLWDVLNTVASGTVGAGATLLAGRLARRDQRHDQYRQLIETIFELAEQAHTDVMGEFALTVPSEDIDPALLARERDRHVDRFAKVGLTLGLIRSKLMLVKSGSARNAYNAYSKLVADEMGRAIAGQLTAEELAGRVVPQLRAYLVQMQQELSSS